MPAAIFYSNLFHFLKKKCWLYPHYRSQYIFGGEMVTSMKYFPLGLYQNLNSQKLNLMKKTQIQNLCGFPIAYFPF